MSVDDADLPAEFAAILADPEVRLDGEAKALALVIADLRRKPSGRITLKRSGLLAMLLAARAMGPGEGEGRR